VSVESVRVELSERSYSVRVGSGALGDVGAMLSRFADHGATRVFIVRDTGVPEAHLGAIAEGARGCGLEPTVAAVTPSERDKSLETYHGLLGAIAASGHTRSDPVVVLGGGIVGDLGGFVAASYLRGVPVIQCPTTLLAMVDASVGGKTGFNLSVGDRLLKNYVGAFHQPTLVCADMDVLGSLGDRYLRSGLAECIKHACICATAGHPDLLGWTRSNIADAAARDAGVLTELVRRNVALKASIVALDEREDPSAKAGGRMLLNLGHTFGHAIETIESLSPTGDPGDGPLHHGEAIGLGLVAAFAAAESMGMVDGPALEGVVSMVGSAGLPVRVAGLPGDEELLARMRRDKKSAGGALRLVLPDGEGSCVIVDDAPESAAIAGLSTIRA
jgi:3-dehydroquinate synthase